jgi:hypothetical protein
MRFPTSEFTPAPEGTHVAQLIGLVDLGTQETDYGARRQVWLSFVLPEERLPSGKPCMVSRKTTFSRHKKAALRPILDALQGRPLTEAELSDGFDGRALLGRCCMVRIVHATKGDAVYANIDAAMPLPRGTKAPPVDEVEATFFSLDEFNAEDFYALQEWQQELIERSPEYAAVATAREPATQKAPRHTRLAPANPPATKTKKRRSAA